MKKIFTFFVLALTGTTLIAQTSGGPDAYGYEWRNSDDVSGPTYNWIDITTTGTQVTGLADDNSVGMVDMNMDFHYYWSDYNQVKIGSNGWLSFENIGNIAHCFPVIPTSAGSGDNILAPFMSDLYFGGVAPSQVWYYHDATNEQFIVSYIDAPWWSPNAPGYTGSNTFQVILSAQDSSITYQYQTTDAVNLLDQVSCNQDLVVGMENITGNIGLGVYTEVVPPSNHSVKFYYPANVTFQVPDATPSWTQNTDDAAGIQTANVPHTLSTNISNEGNTDITTTVTVSLTIQDLAMSTVHSDVITLPNLLVGADQQADFTVPGLSPGQYYVNVEVTNSEDINPSNNTSISELEIVDNTTTPVVMTYATQAAPSLALNWGQTGIEWGGSVRIIPPSYPVTLESVDMYIFSASASGIADTYTVEITADDGPNGVPGTVLATEVMTSGSYIINDWVNTTLSTPIDITSGGIHVIFKTADSVALALEATGPISKRTYEFVSGAWSNHRFSETEDFLINANFAAFSGVGIVEQEDLNISIYPNPNNGVFTIDVKQVSENISYIVTNLRGEIVISNRTLNEATNVDLSEEAKGIYFVQLISDKGVTTKKIVVQ